MAYHHSSGEGLNIESIALLTVGGFLAYELWQWWKTNGLSLSNLLTTSATTSNSTSGSTPYVQQSADVWPGIDYSGGVPMIGGTIGTPTTIAITSL